MDEKETVTISLEKYEELMEHKRVDNETDCTELRQKIKSLEYENEMLKFDNAHLVKTFGTQLKHKLSSHIELLIQEILSNCGRIFGYISNDDIISIYQEFCHRHKDVDKCVFLYEEYPKKKEYNVPIYKNTTKDISNSEFIMLHKDIDSFVYNFLQNHDIPNGCSINYSIDDIQNFKESIDNPSSDRYLGVVDKDNNEIIASM